MMPGIRIRIYYSFLLLLAHAGLVDGFVPFGICTPPHQSQVSQQQQQHCGGALKASFWDDWKGFFNDPNGNNKDDNDEEEYAAGEINVVTIPVKEIKPGGLRLFVMFYLMGLQNTPEKGTWRADQPTSEDYVVDFWYHDNSAVLSITFSEERKKITIDRVGSSPSTGYMIQESLVVQGLLDELESMATDPDVAVENRLLIPKTEQTIEMARDALAFG